MKFWKITALLIFIAFQAFAQNSNVVKDENGRHVIPRGFERITLAPGETKRIEFELSSDNLSLYNQKMEKVTEPGEFTISLGGSSMEKDLKTIKLSVL